MVFSLRVCVSLSLLFYKNISHIAVRAHPNQYDLIFNELNLQNLYFQIRTISQRLGVSTLIYIFWGYNSTETVSILQVESG